MIQGSGTVGAREVTDPPEFPTLNKVGLSQNAQSDRGLIVLAPPAKITEIKKYTFMAHFHLEQQ